MAFIEMDFAGGGGSVSFSETEQKTKSKWIDGSDIYTKTVNFGALPNASNKSVAHGISGIKNLISADALAFNPNSNTWIPSSYVFRSGSTDHFVATDVDATNINITTTFNASIYTKCYVTLFIQK